MDEYISRDKVLKMFIEGDGHDDDRFTEGYNFAVQEHREEVENIPAARLRPEKHGKWEETHISLVKYIPEDEKEEGRSFYMAEMKCSCCNRYNTVTFVLTLDKPDFCQLCGADMRGGDKE